METTLWLKESFSIEFIPDWPCPTCGKALLTLDKEKFQFEEPAESKRNHSHPDWEPEFIFYRFIGILRCSNTKCKELMTFTGSGGVSYNSYFDYKGEGFDKYEDYFIPKYFEPALHLFKINASCPNEISSQIVDAFNLYWCDASACANKIRIALEMIMDDKGIKKTYINKNKERKELALHNRIELFGKKFTELRDPLIAIKWIGNSGSHVGKLERVDLIDAFSLLEYCIEKLYDGREKHLKKISRQINKSKSPRHSRK